MHGVAAQLRWVNFFKQRNSVECGEGRGNCLFVLLKSEDNVIIENRCSYESSVAEKYQCEESDGVGRIFQGS